MDPFLAIQESRVPTICCVHGAALTGGFEIAVSTDIAIASRNAVFRDNHAMCEFEFQTFSYKLAIGQDGY